MGKQKEHGSALAKATTIQIGRFLIVHIGQGKVWITDAILSDGGSFDVSLVEAAIAEMYAREF